MDPAGVAAYRRPARPRGRGGGHGGGPVARIACGGGGGRACRSRAERALGRPAAAGARGRGSTRWGPRDGVLAGRESRRLERAPVACPARGAGGLMKSLVWVLMLTTTLPLGAQEPQDSTATPSNGAEAQQLRKQIRQRWYEHVRTTLALSDDQATKRSEERRVGKE